MQNVMKLFNVLRIVCLLSVNEGDISILILPLRFFDSYCALDTSDSVPAFLRKKHVFLTCIFRNCRVGLFLCEQNPNNCHHSYCGRKRFDYNSNYQFQFLHVISNLLVAIFFLLMQHTTNVDTDLNRFSCTCMYS